MLLLLLHSVYRRERPQKLGQFDVSESVIHILSVLTSVMCLQPHDWPAQHAGFGFFGLLHILDFKAWKFHLSVFSPMVHNVIMTERL